MAEDGPLSQADIDALTAGLLGDSASPGFDAEALRPEAGLFFEQASAVLGALLGRSAALTPLDIRPADAATLDGAFGTEGLAVHASLGGIEGELLFALSRPTAAMLAGLMLGGDGAAPFKDEDIDAINELANQVLGSVCTALGGKHGREVSASQAAASPLDPSNPPFPLDGAVIAEGELAVEGAEPAAFHLVLSRSLADALSGAATGGASASSGPGGGLMASQGSFDDSISRSMAEAPANVQMLLDINLNVTIELGRTRLSIRRILELGPGSIIELDRLAGEPVDLLVNDKVVAKGEVVVVDEYFGIRILSLVSPEERIKQLR
jgi:flagellar motor switch protein FliN/FliY